MRHDKILKLAEGFRGRSKSCFKIAKGRVEKALQYAYISRKLKKRDFRKLWIQRINAAVREHGIAYGQFMSGLNKANVLLDRKMLSELCVNEPLSFKALVDTVTTITPMRQIVRRIDVPVLQAHVQTVVYKPHDTRLTLKEKKKLKKMKEEKSSSIISEAKINEVSNSKTVASL